MKHHGLKIGATYRNYKNKNLYKVVGVGKHSESLEDMVIYEAQYDTENKLWIRPVLMFMEQVTYQGRKQPRFELIEESIVVNGVS